MNKISYIILGIIAVGLAGTAVEAAQMGFSLVLDPNITRITTSYNGLFTNTSSNDPYLTNNTGTIFFNEDYLNGTIDDRAGSGHSNGDNCAAGEYPLGVNASGSVEGCTDATTEITNIDTATNTSMKAYVDAQVGGGPESDPYWTANQSDYYTSTQVDTLDSTTNTSLRIYCEAQDSLQDECSEISGCVVGAITSYTEDDPYWTANQSDYYTSTQVDTLDSTTNTSLKAYIDSLDHTDDQTCAGVSGCVVGAITEIDNWATDVNDYPAACNAGEYVNALGDTLTCTDATIEINNIDGTTNTSMKAYVDGQGFITSYTEDDPSWTGNITECDSNSKLYFSGGSLACNADQLGGGGSGANYWAVSDGWMYPNLTAGGDNDINVTSIKANDWSNVTITKSQVSDFGSYVETEEDPLWLGNYTACATGNHLYFSGGNLACEADNTGTDDQICSEVTGCIENAITEIDNWATDVNDYPAACNAGEYVNALGDTLTCTDATTEINSIDGTTNTSIKAYIDALDHTDDQTCAQVSGCVESAITEIDNWAADVNNYPTACTGNEFVQGLGDTLTCSEPAAGAEADPQWLGNYTACASGNHLYFSGDSLACEADADTPDSDPYWQGNYTACAAGNHLYFSGGNLACEADAGMTDIDNWAVDVNDYPAACNAGEYVNALGDTLTCTDATTEINTIDGTTNTSMKAYVDRLDDLNDFTDSGNVYQDDIGSSCGIDNYAWGIQDDGTILCRADNDSAVPESDLYWQGNYTACASGNHLFFTGNNLDCEVDDDVPDNGDFANAADLDSDGGITAGAADDTAVANDITVDSTKWINTTEGIKVGSSKKICLNEATCTSYIWYNGTATVIV